MTKYYQCLLTRGSERRNEWIEERGAKLGAHVELLPEKEMWVVNTVHTPGLEVEALKEKQKNDRGVLPSIKVVR